MDLCVIFLSTVIIILFFCLTHRTMFKNCNNNYKNGFENGNKVPKKDTLLFYLVRPNARSSYGFVWKSFLVSLLPSLFNHKAVEVVAKNLDFHIQVIQNVFSFCF